MPALTTSDSGVIKIILFRLTFLTFVFSLVFLGMVGSPLRQDVFGDGLTAENLPPATVGDREASLFVKISPPILTTESKENAFLQFRLYDQRDNQTIKYVTYEIAIRKANAPQDSRPLLRDFFHAPNGLLTIKVDPTQSGPVQIFGDRDPFQNALIADPGGTVNVRGPILTDGGLYHIEVRIFGIDNVRNIFLPENAPKYDSYLSIGDVSYHNMTYNGRNYNSTLISYYDEIQNFDYEPQIQQIAWSMPFDWNLTRIRDQNIFVHEEIKLSNAFLEQIGASSTSGFSASVNGQPLVGRALAIDPFTANDTTIVHYLINKNQILDLGANLTTIGTSAASSSNNTKNISTNGTTISTNTSASNANNSTTNGPDGRIDFMSFSLIPKTENTTQSTSSDLTTDTGGIHAMVSWQPKQLAAGNQSTVYLNFSDAFSGETLNADVLYDMSILDSNGTEVIRSENLTAVNSTDSQTVSFPANAIYQIEVNVKGLLLGDQSSPDSTRSGIARGYVVVPEFSSSTSSMLVVGGLFAGLIIGVRWRQGKRKF
jgi:hypothetical protein